MLLPGRMGFKGRDVPIPSAAIEERAAFANGCTGTFLGKLPGHSAGVAMPENGCQSASRLLFVRRQNIVFIRGRRLVLWQGRSFAERPPFCRSKNLPGGLNFYTIVLLQPLFLLPARENVLIILIGGLAQLARALAWHARGHRFDSVVLHEKKASHFCGAFCILNLFCSERMAKPLSPDF